MMNDLICHECGSWLEKDGECRNCLADFYEREECRQEWQRQQAEWQAAYEAENDPANLSMTPLKSRINRHEYDYPWHFRELWDSVIKEKRGGHKLKCYQRCVVWILSGFTWKDLQHGVCKYYRIGGDQSLDSLLKSGDLRRYLIRIVN